MFHCSVACPYVLVSSDVQLELLDLVTHLIDLGS